MLLMHSKLPFMTESYEKFKTLKEEAIKELLALHNSIKKKVADEIALLNERFDAESNEIAKKLAELGHNFSHTKKQSPSKTSSRQKFAKLSDDTIKVKLSELFQGNAKVKSAEIFSVVGISRARLSQFIKANSGFLGTEGNKRSTVYFLKG